MRRGPNRKIIIAAESSRRTVSSSVLAPVEQQHDVQFYLSMMKRDIPKKKTGRMAWISTPMRASSIRDAAASEGNAAVTNPPSSSRLTEEKNNGKDFKCGDVGPSRAIQSTPQTVSLTCGSCRMVNEALVNTEPHCFACGNKLKGEVLGDQTILQPSKSLASPHQQTTDCRRNTPVASPFHTQLISERSERNNKPPQRTLPFFSESCLKCGLKNEDQSESCFACGSSLRIVSPQRREAVSPSSSVWHASADEPLTKPPNRGGFQHNDTARQEANRNCVTSSSPPRMGSPCLREVKITPPPSVNPQCGKCGLLNEIEASSSGIVVPPVCCFACGTSLLLKMEVPKNGNIGGGVVNMGNRHTITEVVSGPVVATVWSGEGSRQQPTNIPQAAARRNQAQQHNSDEEMIAPSNIDGSFVKCQGCGLRNESSTLPDHRCFACGGSLVRQEEEGVQDTRSSNDIPQRQTSSTTTVVEALWVSNARRSRGGGGRMRCSNRTPPSHPPPTSSPNPSPEKHQKQNPAVDSASAIEKQLSCLPRPPPFCPSYFRSAFRGNRIMSRVKSRGLSEVQGRLGGEEEYEAWLYHYSRPLSAASEEGYRAPYLNVARSVSTQANLRPVLGDAIGNSAASTKKFLTEGGVLLNEKLDDEDVTFDKLTSSDWHSKNGGSADVWGSEEGGTISNWATSSYDAGIAVANSSGTGVAEPLSSLWGSTITERLHQPGGLLQKYVPENENALHSSWDQHRHTEGGGTPSSTLPQVTVLSTLSEVCHTLQFAISIPAETLEREWGWSKDTSSNPPPNTDITAPDPAPDQQLDPVRHVIVGRVFSVEYLKPLRIILRSITSGRLDVIENHLHILEREVFMSRYRVYNLFANGMLPKHDAHMKLIKHKSVETDVDIYDAKQLALESILTGNIDDSHIAAGLLGSSKLMLSAGYRWNKAVKIATAKLIKQQQSTTTGEEKDSSSVIEDLDNLQRYKVQMCNVSPKIPISHVDNILVCPSTIPLVDTHFKPAQGDKMAIFRSVALRSRVLPTSFRKAKAKNSMRHPTVLSLYARYTQHANQVLMDEATLSIEITPVIDRCTNCLLRRDVFARKDVGTGIDGSDICELCGHSQDDSPLYATRSRRLQSANLRQNLDQTEYSYNNPSGSFDASNPAGYSPVSSNFNSTQQTGHEVPPHGNWCNNTQDFHSQSSYNYDHFAEWKSRQQEDVAATPYTHAREGGGPTIEEPSSRGCYQDEWSEIDQATAQHFREETTTTNPYHHNKNDPRNATIAPSTISYSGGKGSGHHHAATPTITPPLVMKGYGSPQHARTKLGMALGSALGDSKVSDILPPAVEW